MAEEKSPSVLGKVGKDLLKAFNTGVSYFIPIVVVGGVFLAFSLATGTAGKDGIEVTNPLMQSLQPYWYGWHQDDDSSPCCLHCLFFGRKACSGTWLCPWLPGNAILFL